MPILCEPNPRAFIPRAEELLPGVRGDVRAATSMRAAAQMLAEDPAETLVVIGPDADTSDALAFASALRGSSPAVGVILERDYVDVDLLAMALRAGVRDVVRAGDHAALVDACRRSHEVSMQHLTTAPSVVERTGPEGQIVTVFAAKGGCGKTMLAVNLGVALSAGTGKRVCVVDLDLAFGDVAISVQLQPARTISDALPMAGHLDPTGAASLLTPYQPGLEMLLAPVTPGDAEKVSPALVTELLGVLRGMFDYVVVDTAAQLSEHVLSALDASAHHVLVATPDASSLKNLRVTLDTLDLLDYPGQIRSVVLNRSDSKVGLGLEDVAKVVGLPVAAQIPSSRAVPVSINKGLPITIEDSRHPVSQAVTGFAYRELIGDAAVPSGRRSRSRRARRQA